MTGVPFAANFKCATDRNPWGDIGPFVDHKGGR
jgi:hypothetical protein